MHSGASAFPLWSVGLSSMERRPMLHYAFYAPPLCIVKSPREDGSLMYLSQTFKWLATIVILLMAMLRYFPCFAVLEERLSPAPLNTLLDSKSAITKGKQPFAVLNNVNNLKVLLCLRSKVMIKILTLYGEKQLYINLFNNQKLN